MKLSPDRQRRSGAMAAGILGMAVSSLMLLCGAGLTPTGTVQTADINANGFSITNAATIQAATVIATNGFTPPSSYVLPKANGGTGTATPGLVAGTNVTVTGTWPNQTVNAVANEWELASTSFTAVASHRYQIDTTAAAITVTLPATANAMDAIEVADAMLSWDSHNVTLAGNGLKINGGTTNYVASVPGNKLSLVYISAGYGWSVK